MTELTPASLGRAYGIESVIDYGPRRAGSGLLISAGAGMLMAMMDQLPACRWALDTGTIRGHPRAADWAEACSWLVSHVACHLWLTVTGPEWVRGVLQRFPPDRLAVWSNVPLGLGYQAADTADLARWSTGYRAEPANAGRAQRGHRVVAGPRAGPGSDLHSPAQTHARQGRRHGHLPSDR
jgi:hypothetical protein